MKKSSIFLLIFCIIAFALLSAGCSDPDAIRTDVPRSSQDDYPVLPEPTANITYMEMPFDTLNELSCLVVRGTVVEQLPDKQAVSRDGEDADEDFPPIVSNVHRFSIEVTDTIRGEAADRIIIGRNEIYDGATPDLNPGDEFIFFLTRYQDRGDYIVTSFQEGYYYIAADNRVYPVKLQDSTRAYSGMGLSEFKKEIRSYQYVEPDF